MSAPRIGWGPFGTDRSTDRWDETWTPTRALLLLVAVGCAYAAGSEMAYEWFDADGTNASFFPAAGVTMSALLTFDRRWWPSVLLGAGLAEVLVDLTHDLSLAQGLGYAAANLVQPVVAAVVLRRTAQRLDLARISQLGAFLLAGVVIGPFVGGVAGASVHLASGGDEFVRFAAEWWVGDGLGVLVVGAILLGLRASTPAGAVAAGTVERLLYLGVAVSSAVVAFRFDVFALAYLPFGLLFVIAVRSGTRDVSVVGALVAFVAAEGTARGHRFWESTEVIASNGLMYLQLALAVMIAGALVMAAALAEREVSTMARSDALSAQREATLARRRAEFLGRLGEAFGRATRATDVREVLREFGLARAWPVDRASAVSDDEVLASRPTTDVTDVTDDVVIESARRMVTDVLARVQLIEGERAARLRAEMLEHHAARLAAVASIDDVARATVDGLCDLHPRSAAVWRLVPGALVLLAAARTSDADVRSVDRVPIDADLPEPEAARTGQVITCDTNEEMLQRYPEVGRRGGGTAPAESVTVVPLHGQNRQVIGVLVVASNEPHWLSDAHRQVLLSMSDQCGLALDRAELQASAERGAADAALLARLGDALDRATTAHERARHVVGELMMRGADSVAIELAGEDGHRVLAAGGPVHALLHPDQVVPLQARGRVLGRISIGGDLGPTGRALVQAIASRAAIGIDNALLYERERDVSHRLQLGLLDVSFPQVDTVHIDGAYRPGTATLDIGGDWYDAFRLPSGALALVVGDVVGHGLEAAIAMAQLRGAVRALAAISSPSELLDRLDVFVDSLPDADMTTLVYVELEPATGRFRYACAGHPPPLIVSATGVSRLLWDARSTPLGSQFHSRRVESIGVLGDAERLVLYTDGLVERRAEQLDVGLDRLLATSSHDVASVDFVERLCDRMLEGVPQRDDVCVLTATRLDDRSFARTLRALPTELVSLRRELRVWLAAWVPSEAMQRDVLLAVAEAVSNAVEHGVSHDGEQPIVVVASVVDDQVRVTVRDHGVWREPAASTERGRGLGIMRVLMDDVAVERHDDGTIVRLRVAMPA